MAINLNTDQVAALKGFIQSAKYSDAYNYLRDVVNQKIPGESNYAKSQDLAALSAWFGAAAHINANDGSFVSEFVRGSTEFVMRSQGQSVTNQQFQDSSNQLARTLLTQIAQDGSVGSAQQIVNADIQNAMNTLNMPSWGWPGAVTDFLTSPIGLNQDVASVPLDKWKIMSDATQMGVVRAVDRQIRDGIISTADNLISVIQKNGAGMFDFLSPSGAWATTYFGNVIPQQVLTAPSGGSTSMPPHTLPEVVVTATRLTPPIAAIWTMPNADGTVTKIGIGANNKYFTIEQKSDNTSNATILKRGEITIDASGVHNTTFNKDGWSTVTTDPATNQITSNSTVVVQASGSSIETVTYSNGRVVHITTDTSGNKTQEIVSTAMESFISAAGTVLDALSLVKAIQSGQPLPVVASGLRLANNLTSTPVLDATGHIIDTKPASYSLSGAANVAGGLLSLMSLDAALKRGDTLGVISAGAQTISFGAAAYANLVLGQTSNAAFAADSFIGQTNAALPYINVVNSIAQGDAVGTAINTLAIAQPQIGVPLAVAYSVFNMVSSLFGGSDAPPEAWGSAHAQWTGFTATTSSVGQFGGLESATQTYNGVLSYLDQLAAREQYLNPGSSIGIVANRLPSLSYRNYTGYQITDIDPLTGVQRNPDTKYDLTGHPYNAPAGSVQASQSLSERMIRVALERGALAPIWEVQTAALQTQAGDPMAGLTEEERAGRAGLLAAPVTGNSQVFRPVALDLNGDGVQTTGANRTVAFDVDGTGYLKNTAWLNNNDGFLFLDRNLNGSIDTGSELFNNSVVSLTARGLNGMRWIDSNYDGRLTALDPVWNELKVWQDANGNGSADAGEVKTLAQLGISALNYAMSTFEQNGQIKQLASPDLQADTEGTRTHVVPEGIIIQSSNGKTSLLVTRLDDRSVLEANRDGITSYEDIETIISGADLLANDTLAGLSGSNLSITGVSGFTHGTGFLDGNGFVHYNPDANYFGAAQFNYTLKASTGQSGAANDCAWFCERLAA